MTEAQIKHMVNRFLGWKLPESFNPDGGISFKKTFNEHTDHPMKHEPSGTNLFDAAQAETMVRHMIEGLPNPIMEDALRAVDAVWSKTFPEGPDGAPPDGMIRIFYEHATVWRKVRAALAGKDDPLWKK